MAGVCFKSQTFLLKVKEKKSFITPGQIKIEQCTSKINFVGFQNHNLHRHDTYFECHQVRICLSVAVSVPVGAKP